MKAKLIVAALVLSTMWACNKKEEEAAPPPPPPPKPKEFVAPSDGLLQPEKAARWRQADSLVRLLDEAPRNPANAAAFQAAGLSMAIPVSEKKAGKGK